jgi:uncharacterized protein (TIGR02001 family)
MLKSFPTLIVTPFPVMLARGMDAAFVLHKHQPGLGQRQHITACDQKLSRAIRRGFCTTERVVMKKLKVLSALSLLAVAGAANAEVSGSMGIASSYHWRGFDLGSGTPAVSGELKYSTAGFYAALWGSSGDTTGGTELDAYAGYAGSAGAFSYDVSLISYMYPTGAFKAEETFGKFAESVVKLGFGPVGFSWNHNLAGASKGDFYDCTTVGDNCRYAFAQGKYDYFTLSAKFGAFSALIGHHMEKDWTYKGGFAKSNVKTEKVSKLAPGVTGDATHLDLTYAYNDNLSFTLSGILDSKFDNDTEPKPKLVVSYAVPFGK